MDEKTSVEEQLLEDNRRLRYELKGLQKRYKSLIKQSQAKSRKITELKKSQTGENQHYKNGKRGRRF